MKSNSKKLLVYSLVFVLAPAGLLFGYTRLHAPRFAEWSKSRGPRVAVASISSPSSPGRLLSDDRETGALIERNERRGRSPAFVPGSAVDANLKASVERLLAEPRVAVAHDRLKESFPDTSPIGFWIRAAIALGTVPLEGELSPENFEAIGKVYSEILNGEESAIVALETGLKSLPRSEGLARHQAVRMLSDIGTTNRALRENVKAVLLAETDGGIPDRISRSSSP